ncbi:hypothetical protein QYM36_002208 [Artemia franciscana]|uniref:Uncharacterized protein n=1 Tax=Artemia franciscana TaxID=6661 RepID=A0AA88IC04_ARTSF|nr:hypothetical protein QYM36_002208 [Artemia franciscana]
MGSKIKDENRFEDRASPDRESDELKIVPTRFPKPPKRNQEFNHVDLNITYEESETDGFQAVENHMPRFKSSFGRKISQNYGSNLDRSESDQFYLMLFDHSFDKSQLHVIDLI